MPPLPPVPSERKQDRQHRHLVVLSIAAGVLLAIIGIRFLIVPRTAANTFGLAKEIAGYELHHIIGLRDLWLAVLAIALALLHQWRALMWWFGLGALVCLADATIVATSSGKPLNVAFHVGSGIFCAALAAALRRRVNRD